MAVKAMDSNMRSLTGEKCLACGAPKLGKIIYGLPDSKNAALQADLRAGAVRFGGCVVDEESPKSFCIDCEKKRSKRRKTTIVTMKAIVAVTTIAVILYILVAI